MVDKKKFEKEGYTITITSKIPLSKAIENYIYEKLDKFERFASHILEVIITLDIQKVTHIVSIRMKFLHFMLKVQARTENLYSAIDMASDRIIKLIEKYKKKMQTNRVKERVEGGLEVQVLNPISYVEEINEQIDDENRFKEEELYKLHDVVSTESMTLRMLTQGEAAVKLELSKDNFILYKGEEDQKIKLMYKREDGNLGLVTVEK